jgi:hypothetical protein
MSRGLGNRYAKPLPKPTDEVAALATKVERHFAKLGVSWS